MDDIKTTYGHKNRLVRKFFDMKLEYALKFADLKKSDIILDFGCGSGHLKKVLKNYKVIGYDITPKHSDIKDYNSIKPDKIFAMDVFEHMPLEEIEKTIKNFKKMNHSFKLITAIPTENALSVFLRRLVGKPDRAEGHITRFRDIKSLLDRELKLIKSKKIFTMTYVALYKNEKI